MSERMIRGMFAVAWVLAIIAVASCAAEAGEVIEELHARDDVELAFAELRQIFRTSAHHLEAVFDVVLPSGLTRDLQHVGIEIDARHPAAAFREESPEATGARPHVEHPPGGVDRQLLREHLDFRGVVEGQRAGIRRPPPAYGSFLREVILDALVEIRGAHRRPSRRETSSWIESMAVRNTIILLTPYFMS